MADFTLGPAHFPVGTTVGAYVRKAFVGETGPLTAAVTTAVTDANLETVFSGLAYDTAYWAAAQLGGVWRKVAFTTEPDPALVAATLASVNAAIAALTKASVGLGNVDNTSDASKPISAAAQAAIDADRVRLGSLESTRPLTTNVWVRAELPPYVLPGGEAGDDTTKITSALAEGRTLYLPKGVYRALNLQPPGEGLTIQGEGRGLTDGTRIKALGGATDYAIKNQGKRFVTIANLIIDGNGRAVNGMLTGSSASATSQDQVWRDVMFYRCLTGLRIDGGGLTQADKNTLYNPLFVECSTGLLNASTNGQSTILINADFASIFDIGVRVSNGNLKMIGGMFQSESAAGKRCIVIDGANVDVVDLDEVITEGVSHAIDGAAAWPRNGVIVRGGCVLQGTVSNVKMPANALLDASNCVFNIGNVIATGADPVFFERFVKWTNGATWDASGATTPRRFRLTVNGWDDGVGKRAVGAAGQPAFATGWANLGSGFAPLTFECTTDNTLRITGSVNSAGGHAANSEIFTLPAGLRPMEGTFRDGCVTTAGGLNVINVATTGVVSHNLAVAAGVGLFINSEFRLIG